MAMGTARVTLGFRAMAATDRDLVVSGWSSSLRMSHYAGFISMKRWASVMHVEINATLDHPDVSTLVAEEIGETDHMGRSFLYGFITWSSTLTAMPYVFYCYVKRPYRRGTEQGMVQGHAAQLFAAAGIDPTKPFSYACRTGVCAQLARKVPLAEFDPLPGRFLDRPGAQYAHANHARDRHTRRLPLNTDG